jgi:hypothetical protein
MLQIRTGLHDVPSTTSIEIWKVKFVQVIQTALAPISVRATISSKAGMVSFLQNKKQIRNYLVILLSIYKLG